MTTEQSAEITGRLEKWYVNGTMVNGAIYDDKRNRWIDGYPIHTSRVIVPALDHLKEGDIIITLNSTYILGKPA